MKCTAKDIWFSLDQTACTIAVVPFPDLDVSYVGNKDPIHPLVYKLLQVVMGLKDRVAKSGSGPLHTPGTVLTARYYIETKVIYKAWTPITYLQASIPIIVF